MTQIICILCILISMAYPTWGATARSILGAEIFGGVPWLAVVTEASKWAAVGLTLLSGSIYLWRNRELYLRDM
ncbi:MAG: hypothetical protein JNL97_14310 [Verrucomicrobiales bacterium]|nr:hypothetical protein [Verrucomicrobiales bacterium]